MPMKPGTKKTLVYGGAAAGGAVLIWYLYKRYQASAAAGGTTAGAPTTGVGSTSPLIPAPTPSPTTTPSGGTHLPWRTRMIDYMVNTFKIRGGENVAATGLERAMSGHCVGPVEYAALNAAFGAIGQPSGSMIILQRCPRQTRPTRSHTNTETPGHAAHGGGPGGETTSAAGTVTHRARSIAAQVQRALNMQKVVRETREMQPRKMRKRKPIELLRALTLQSGGAPASPPPVYGGGGTTSAGTPRYGGSPVGRR
jgi:hypothetical protein